MTEKNDTLVTEPARDGEGLVTVRGRFPDALLTKVEEEVRAAPAPAEAPPAPPAPPTPEELQVGLLDEILKALKALAGKVANQTEPIGLAGADHFEVRRVRVTTALSTTAEVVQGPAMYIPEGFQTTVRMRRHSGSAPVGYVAKSRSAVTDDTSRMVMQDNDSVSLYLSNWDQLYFGADTADTYFELIAERNPRRA